MISADEFFQRFSGRYFGKYRGVVVSVDDPQQKGRLILKVPVVMGSEEVGWALPSPAAGGGVNTGDFLAPEKNDFVWVEFEEGDVSRPIWSPGPWGIRSGTSMLPEHGRGQPDDLDFSVRDQGNIPPSQFAGTYGNVRTIRSKDGSLLEFDATPGAERVQLSHFTGTRVEFNADGGYQEISTANTKRRTEGAQTVEIGGDEEVFIGGNRTVQYDKDVSETFGGNLSQTFQEVTQSGKSLSQIWEGGKTESCGGTWSVASNSQGRMSFGGQLAFMIGQNLQATVMENLEIAASNATNVVPTAPVITLHGYNGNVVIQATDPTGLVNQAQIVLVGNTVPGTPMIKFGGDAAVQPFVLGNILLSLLTALITDLSTHQHPTGVGPSGPPITTPIYTQLLSQLSTILSLEIFGK